MRTIERGTAFVESLLAVPIVLLLGLGALQWALLFHARTAVEHALIEAARAGTVAQARPDAIEAGLARGLMPFWQGVDATHPWPVAVGAANARLREGLTAGWIAWRQLAPTVESFGDWGEAARDAMGHPLPATVEIPNDSLQWGDLRRPAGGVAGMRDDEPIGALSQQTLNDANLLKLELRYGVPMNVPLVGRIAVWVMRIVDDCVAPSRRRLGPVDLGVPVASAAPRPWACAMYLAPDASGVAVPRWPVRASATMRMQSPARRSAMTPRRTQSPVPGAAGRSGTEAAASDSSHETGSGPVAADAQSTAQLAPTGADAPVTATAADDGSLARAPGGWLHMGGERSFTVPGACT